MRREPVFLKPGDKLHRLTVVKLSHIDGHRRRHLDCLCDCGNRVTVIGCHITAGNTKSCGCLRRISSRLRGLSHGTASMRQVMAGYKYKAKKAGRVFQITEGQFLKIADKPCFYCGSPPANVNRSPHACGDFVYSGMDRVDTRKGYTIANVVPCCRKCNLSKNNRSQGEFIEWIRKAFIHLSSTAMANLWPKIH